mmetsp:Transcript_1497/g.4043  ORF Transcript_1497/g.4043 Transcript_1497/m.4043 type:complete len:234 (+) Transcript_1497:3216-3917(+)
MSETRASRVRGWAHWTTDSVPSARVTVWRRRILRGPRSTRRPAGVFLPRLAFILSHSTKSSISRWQPPDGLDEEHCPSCPPVWRGFSDTRPATASLTAKLWKLSRMGRYPVHRQMFPSKCDSICSCVGCGVLTSSPFICIANPGVHMPHWLALLSTIACCTGSRPAEVLPIPSIVVTCIPSSVATGRRQELILTVFTPDSEVLSMPVRSTVQTPHPPWLHIRFVPLRPGVDRK